MQLVHQLLLLLLMLDMQVLQNHPTAQRDM
jgi:hypothetical protein